MLTTNGITLDVTKDALDLLAEDGYDPEFGARPVKKNYSENGSESAFKRHTCPESRQRPPYSDRQARRHTRIQELIIF